MRDSPRRDQPRMETPDGCIAARFSASTRRGRQRDRTERSVRDRREPRARPRPGAGAAHQERQGDAERLPVLLGRAAPRSSTPSTARSSTSRAIRAARTTRARLCPKGAAIYQLHVNPNRPTQGAAPRARRRPTGRCGTSSGRWTGSPSWSRRRATRRSSSGSPNGKLVNMTPAIFSLGGATLDNEWNHVQQKLHARPRASSPSRTRPGYDTAPASPVWGRGSVAARRPCTRAAWWTRTASSDQGSNMAECHPVAFRWVMKAKLSTGAKLIHVDPRFTRTSAMADIYAPIRAGSDIVFLGGLINHVHQQRAVEHRPFFKEFVVNYTNAATHHRRRVPGHRGPATACSRA